jgi:hypothetical protein
MGLNERRKVQRFSADETRLRSAGTATLVGPQVTSEFRFDEIAGRELLAAACEFADLDVRSTLAAEQCPRIAMGDLRGDLWR